MRLQLLTRLLSASRQQAGSLLEIHRHAATQTFTADDRKRYQSRINTYHKQRAEWKRQMTELRKKWVQELHEAQQAELAAAPGPEAAQEPEVLAASAEDAGGTEYDGQLKKLMRQLEDAQLAYEVAVDKLKRAERESLRKQILQQHEAARFGELVEHSKQWITPDTLDARINEILDSPASLAPPPVPLEGSQTA